MLNLTQVKAMLPEKFVDPIEAQMNNWLNEELKTTLIVRGFSLYQIPLLFLTSPKIIQIDDQVCRVKMPFRRMVKNHIGSLYFGALAIGADTCIGMLAVDKMRKQNKNINFLFKDFKANFLKRAEGETIFICEEGDKVNQMIEETIATGERVNTTIAARAECHGEIVAEFELTLSLKNKS